MIIDDLPLSVFKDIAKTTGVRWLEIWATPCEDAWAAELLIGAACERWGIEPPELTAGMLVQIMTFDKDEETRPGMYTEGMPIQLSDGSPLVENEPQTG